MATRPSPPPTVAAVRPKAILPVTPASFPTASPIIKEELFASLNCSLGKDPNAVISIHHDHCKEEGQDGLSS